MLEKGVIEASNSELISVVVFSKNKDEFLMFCIDYRRLNVVTVRDSYPIPGMEHCIESLGAAAVFTTLDDNSGYW